MDGAAYCWGRNDSGQLGTNLVAETCMSGVSRPCGTTPVAVSGGFPLFRWTSVPLLPALSLPVARPTAEGVARRERAWPRLNNR